MTERSKEQFTVPLSAEGYAEANEAFRQCWSADRDEVLAFLAQHLPHDLATQPQVDVLGVGVGDGEFDIRIIGLLREHIGNASLNYVAVEPNEAQLQRFQRRMASADLAQVDFDWHPQRAEDYGVDRGFDLVHYIHSLYHMPTNEECLVREAVDALKPNGVVVLALSAEQGGIYQIMNRFWNVIDYSHFTSGLFGQESLRALLERNAITYDYELYPDVYIDVTDCFDQASERGQHLLNFLLQADMRQVPQQVRDDALAALAELATEVDGRYRLAHPSGVFAIAKP